MQHLCAASPWNVNGFPWSFIQWSLASRQASRTVSSHLLMEYVRVCIAKGGTGFTCLSKGRDSIQLRQDYMNLLQLHLEKSVTTDNNSSHIFFKYSMLTAAILAMETFQ